MPNAKAPVGKIEPSISPIKRFVEGWCCYFFQSAERKTGVEKTDCLRENNSRREVIRLIGVGVTNLDRGENRQVTLFEWKETSEAQARQREKTKKLDAMMENVQNKFGQGMVRKGLRNETSCWPTEH